MKGPWGGCGAGPEGSGPPECKKGARALGGVVAAVFGGGRCRFGRVAGGPCHGLPKWRGAPSELLGRRVSDGAQGLGAERAILHLRPGRKARQAPPSAVSPRGHTACSQRRAFPSKALADASPASLLVPALPKPNRMRSISFPALALAVTAGPLLAQDFVVPAGQAVVYDTTQGPLAVDNFIVQPGATLRVVGPKPFVVNARKAMLVDGLVDLSGGDRPDVATLHTGNQPEVGAPGNAGGGFGGVGSFNTVTSTPMGGAGFGHFGLPGLGGAGGETGFGNGSLDNYHGAGGGGGALGPDEPGAGPGLAAQGGHDGGFGATGAVFGLQPPQGGARGPSPFVDGNPDNDFWGVKPDPAGAVLGELRRPRAGTGGGAGGDGVQGPAFPALPWTPSSDAKGCGGGGGGGLGLMKARFVAFGPGGRIVADGGDGGAGEAEVFTSHAGGGSGGGSGGFLVLQATVIDLSLAAPDCLSALGGRGGAGKLGTGGPGAGGDGGPGVIQLHAPTPGHVLLPAGTAVGDLSVPDAHVLLPIL